MRARYWLLLPALVCWSGPAQADVKPHSLFQNNMVLQQGPKAPVWGTSGPEEKIVVRFNGQEIETAADKAGKWLVHLKDLKAGGPYELTIAGANSVTLKNVLVGEVWVASGQSNMEWRVNSSGKADVQAAKSAPRNPMLRMFTVAKIPEEARVGEVKGTWTVAAPESVGDFSSCAYFFGRELQDKLKVPVGMINTSWGGTRAEAWTSRPVLRKLGPMYDKEVTNHEANFEKNPKVAKNANAPSVLYNGMIHPLLPYRIKGFIWYQGESNVGKAYHYEDLFGTMIQSWRQAWNEPKLPFYFVQLAPFLKIKKEAGESAWAELRETQRQVARKIPLAGMAVITDLGHEADIHPTPKKPVGQRLAWMALEDVYNGMPRRSPDLKSMEFKNGKAIVTLTADKLMSLEMVPTEERKNGAAWRVKEGSVKDADILGFSIAGQDRKFFNAKAQLHGSRVIVSCDQVSEPVAVRYGWADHPVCNLFAVNGLPVTPFRSDTFPFTTQPKTAVKQ